MYTRVYIHTYTATCVSAAIPLLRTNQDTTDTTYVCICPVLLVFALRLDPGILTRAPTIKTFPRPKFLVDVGLLWGLYDRWWGRMGVIGCLCGGLGVCRLCLPVGVWVVVRCHSGALTGATGLGATRRRRVGLYGDKSGHNFVSGMLGIK